MLGGMCAKGLFGKEKALGGGKLGISSPDLEKPIYYYYH